MHKDSRHHLAAVKENSNIDLVNDPPAWVPQYYGRIRDTNHITGDPRWLTWLKNGKHLIFRLIFPPNFRLNYLRVLGIGYRVQGLGFRIRGFRV